MLRKKKASMIGNKIEDEKISETEILFQTKKESRKANLSRSDNHRHPQNGQINLSQGKPGCSLYLNTFKFI